MNREDLIEGLNDRQKEAVLTTEGPVLVLAGAGSGKTRILTHRIGYLILKGVRPWNILAITFTNKAAKEMKDRTDSLLGSGQADMVFVSTFHSMCVRLLRRDIEKLGYGSDFVIYDADDQRTLIRGCIRELNLDTKMYRDRAVQSIISSRKNLMMSADDYSNIVSDFYERNVSKVYSLYEKRLKENNALDFDDLLIKTVELFKKYPEVLAFWQDRFRYIMVDEYQDTNSVQFEIVRMLAEGSGNLCVVGDDDQSIYRFRGADIRNILDFEKSFPGAAVIKLEQNYRSTRSILNAANAVIKNNRGRKEKSLWTENEEGALPVYNEYETAAEEADEIVKRACAAAKQGIRLRDQAILYRTNAQSRLLEEKCVSRNVPYVIVGGMNFYQRKEIKDMLAYLRVISNGQDDISCMRILNVPKRGIGQTTSDRTAEYARSKDIGFFAALKKSGDFLTGAAAKKTLAFTGMIESFRKRFFSGELDIRELIEAVAEETGYEEELIKEDPISAETRMENIGELVNKAADFEANYSLGANAGISRDAFEVNANAGFDDPISIRPEDMLAVFLEEISLISELDRTDPEEDVITMMTLHSAKGLEFDRVYLCGMEDGLFPSMAAIGSNNPDLEIEEERRLCYVGFTRAKKELFLSSAASRMINGDFRSQIGSRFIEEIPDEMAEKHYRRNRSGRYADSRDSFAGFGGYEGSLEYSSRSREEMYGLSGNRFQDSAYRREESSFRDRAYDGGYGSSSSQGGYGSYTGGRYGSLDTAPAGRRNSGRAALSQISIPGLKKGFGESDPVKKKPEYEVGDRVEHVKFGTGIVLSIEEDKKDYKVTVNFDKAGVKAMYAGFAKLRRM